jgi:hypothetical protein
MVIAVVEQENKPVTGTLRTEPIVRLFGNDGEFDIIVNNLLWGLYHEERNEKLSDPEKAAVENWKRFQFVERVKALGSAHEAILQRLAYLRQHGHL